MLNRFVRAKTFISQTEYKNGDFKMSIKNGYQFDTKELQKIKAEKRKEKLNDYRDLLELQMIGSPLAPALEKKLERKYAPKYVNGIRALSRARKVCFDLIRNNDFTYFVTLTLDSKIIDRYSFDEMCKAMKLWTNNMRKQFVEMTYIMLYEKHQDGAYHFHGLIGNVTATQLKLVDSGKIKNGRTIYNITAWKYGFSTVTEIESLEKTRSYISKYLTKDGLDIDFRGKKRYYASRNLHRPIITKTALDGHCADLFDTSPFDTKYADPKKQYAVYVPKKQVQND